MAESFLPPVVATLIADTKQFKAKMAEAGAEFEALEAKGRGMGPALAKGFGLGAVAVGGLAVAVAGEATKMAMDFGSSMTQIQSAGNLTAGQTKSLQDAFLNTMGKSEFSATELATAYAAVAGKMTLLNNGTVNTAGTMDVMNAAQELAVAKNIDLNTATGALATTMQTYSAPLSQAADLSNQLYIASTLTGTSTDSLAGTMQRLHSKVSVALPSMSDMNAFLMDLTQHGVGGGRALTGATGAIDKLLSPTKEGAGLLQSLNIQTFGLDGKFVGLRSVIDQLSPAFQHMNQEQQISAATMLFGAGQAQTMTKIILDGAAGYDKAAASVANHTSVTQAAATQSENLHNQLKTLKAAASDIMIKVGLAIVPQAQQILNAVLGKPGHGPAYEITLNIKEAITTVVGNKTPASTGGFWGNFVKGIGQGFKDVGAGVVDLGWGAANVLAAGMTLGQVPAYNQAAGSSLGAGGRSVWDLANLFGVGSAAQKNNTTGGRNYQESRGLRPVDLGNNSDWGNQVNPAGNANILPKGWDQVGTSTSQTADNTKPLGLIASKTDYTSQHTYEANQHLKDIKGAIKTPPKIIVKASFT